MQIKSIALAAFIMLSLVSPGQSRAETSSTGDFVKSAAASGSFEVMSSNLALTLSSNKDVRDFAQLMVDDHTKIADQLKAIVPGLKVSTMDDMVDKQEKIDLDRLKTETGAAFDRDYIALQLKGHQDAVKLFDDYAKNGDNNKLKAFAAANLPTLQKHLAHVQEMRIVPGM